MSAPNYAPYKLACFIAYIDTSNLINLHHIINTIPFNY